MSSAKKKCLIVFVKSPTPGDVKTRLIPHLTGQEAAELYKCFVTDILRTTQKLGTDVRLHVAYQPHPRASDLSWVDLPNTPPMFRQEGKSLGERLVHAFGLAFGRGAQHVVIIGSDSPALPKAHLDHAFSALNDADVVLGPATDGGYYLIGLSRPCLRLFDDVSWSGDQVFEKTAQNAQVQGYKLKVLPMHFDIDTFDDLKVLQRHLSKDGLAAPVTKKFLAALAKSKPGLAV